MPSTLFLVYRPGKKYTYWTFPNLSKYEWEWVGSGSTGNSSMPNESQWRGPSKYKDKAKKILTEAHKKLQNKDVIDKFVITSSIQKYMKSSPYNKKSTTKKSTTKKTTPKRSTPKKSTSKKTTPKRSIPKKSTTKKSTKKPSKKSSTRKPTRCGTYKFKKAKHINRDSTKQVSDKYINRPSPPYHASAFCGEEKKGNDGEWYFSKKMRNGTCRWVKI